MCNKTTAPKLCCLGHVMVITGSHILTQTHLSFHSLLTNIILPLILGEFHIIHLYGIGFPVLSCPPTHPCHLPWGWEGV